MVTDPIADMLTRLRNASTARLERAEMPHSKMKERVAQILKDEGYIEGFTAEGTAPGKLTLHLKYGPDRVSAFIGIRRTSRTGRRDYVGHRDIPRVHNGLGVAILSTSRGLMTDRTARAERIGGEVVCEVW